MKKLEITSAVLVPGDAEGQMITLHPGSVVELDDRVAGEVLAAQRGKPVDKAARLKDTTKEHEAAAEARAAEQLSPQAMIAAAVAAAVQQVMAKPPETTKA